MRGSPIAPERRLSQSAAREVKRDAVLIEATVAFVLVLSLVVLIYIVSRDAVWAALAAAGIA